MVLPHSWDGLSRDAGVLFSPSPCGRPVTSIYTVSPSGLQHGSQTPCVALGASKSAEAGAARPCRSAPELSGILPPRSPVSGGAGLVQRKELHSGGRVTRGHTTTLIFQGMYAFSICRAM